MSRQLQRYYGRLRLPPGSPPTSRLITGYRARHSNGARPPGRVGPPQFPPPPSERSTPHTPGGSSGLRFQALHPFHGLHPDDPGSAPPLPCPKAGWLTTRQASLHAADRSVAPPKGLSTLGFDPARYQTEPPACYRASWQLPGRDSHPPAAASFCSDQVTPSTTSESLGTRRTSNRRRHGPGEQAVGLRKKTRFHAHTSITSRTCAHEHRLARFFHRLRLRRQHGSSPDATEGA